MSTKANVSVNSARVLSFVFFGIAFILFITWMIVGWIEGPVSLAQKKAVFLDKFPSWLSFTAIHILSLVCCIIAIAFASRSFRKKDVMWRVIMMVIVMFSILIILFDVAQLA